MRCLDKKGSVKPPCLEHLPKLNEEAKADILKQISADKQILDPNK